MTISRTRLMVRITVAMLGAALPRLAAAQDKHVVGGGTVAVIAPPPTPVVVYNGQPGYGYNQAGYGYQPNGYPVVQNASVIVLPDGRIYANFGFGYEPVMTVCSRTSVTADGIGAGPMSIRRSLRLVRLAIAPCASMTTGR